MTPDLTLSHFADCVQRSFTTADGDAELNLVLIEASKGIGGAPGGREPFALLFRGPASPRLRQATYAVVHPTLGSLPIFLVPVGEDADGMLYEAVFA
ncbi:MAG TPA: hypothetical protein VHU82_00705 [Vicinamibacterales bacterium]|nr:hypothetical protein [Vicinamibacterales bacterium]